MRWMRMASALTMLAFLAACSKPVPGPAPSPAPPPAPPSIEAPAKQTSLSFTVIYGDQSHEVPGEIQLAGGDPVTLIVRFPVAMDLERTERILRDRLPSGSKIHWLSSLKAEITVPAGGDFRLEAPGAPAADETGQVAPGAVQFVRPILYTLALYQPLDLMAGKVQPARSHEFRAPVGALAMAPDGETLLQYVSDPYFQGPAPHLLRLPGKQSSPIALPGGFAQIGDAAWLSDGRLILAGRSGVLIGDSQGRNLAQLVNAPVTAAQASPDGRRLALWEGTAVTLLDLQTGESTVLPQRFQSGRYHSSATLAFSPDGKYLAGSDSDIQGVGNSPRRIRIIEAATGKEIRTIEGMTLTDWLATGDLLAWHLPPSTDPELGESVLLGSDFKEKRRLGRWGLPSPDGRYLVQSTARDGGFDVRLVEIATGKAAQFPLPAWPMGWSPSGLLMTITR